VLLFVWIIQFAPIFKPDSLCTDVTPARTWSDPELNDARMRQFLSLRATRGLRAHRCA